MITSVTCTDAPSIQNVPSTQRFRFLSHYTYTVQNKISLTSLSQGMSCYPISLAICINSHGAMCSLLVSCTLYHSAAESWGYLATDLSKVDWVFPRYYSSELHPSRTNEAERGSNKTLSIDTNKMWQPGQTKKLRQSLHV